MLWPYFHYVVQDDLQNMMYQNDAWMAYKSLNQRFADVIVENYQEGDISKYHYFLCLVVYTHVLFKSGSTTTILCYCPDWSVKSFHTPSLASFYIFRFRVPNYSAVFPVSVYPCLLCLESDILTCHG